MQPIELSEQPVNSDENSAGSRLQKGGSIQNKAELHQRGPPKQQPRSTTALSHRGAHDQRPRDHGPKVPEQVLRLSVKVDVPHKEQAHDGYLREKKTGSVGEHSIAEGVDTGVLNTCSARNSVAKNDDAAAVLVV